MRIWIVNHYASPPDQPTGTRHYDLGRVLVRQEHDVTIFASGFSHITLREDRLQANERMRIDCIDGVCFVGLRTTPYSANDGRRVLNMLSYAFNAIRVPRRMPRPDVVVGSSVHLAAVAAAFVKGKARRAPFVFEVRDLWPQVLVDMGVIKENGTATRVLRRLESFLYRRARVIVSLPPRAVNYMTRLGIPREKVVYIPNGIADHDERVSEPNDSSTALLAQISQLHQAGCIIAGYVGSHVRANGVDSLVASARALRDRGVHDVALVFVGDGLEKEKSRQLAVGYDLRNVMFWDAAPKRCVPAVLDALDIALFALHDMSTYKYGLSCNKLFDHMASARPIVSACAAENTLVAAAGAGICVPSDSPDDIADAPMKLRSMGETERHAIGERARHWVYEHHGATALAGRFLGALAQARQ
jgi:glycosyltransferase involved in cell wall biosynthesis